MNNCLKFNPVRLLVCPSVYLPIYRFKLQRLYVPQSQDDWPESQDDSQIQEHSFILKMS